VLSVFRKDVLVPLDDTTVSVKDLYSRFRMWNKNQYCIASCDVEITWRSSLTHLLQLILKPVLISDHSWESPWYLWNHCQTLMNSRMQKFVHETFRPEVWGRVHHSEIHHLFEQHMRLKITAQDKTDLADYLPSPLCS
jgi:hypothetical protein